MAYDRVSKKNGAFSCLAVVKAFIRAEFIDGPSAMSEDNPSELKKPDRLNIFFFRNGLDRFL